MKADSTRRRIVANAPSRRSLEWEERLNTTPPTNTREQQHAIEEEMRLLQQEDQLLVRFKRVIGSLQQSALVPTDNKNWIIEDFDTLTKQYGRSEKSLTALSKIIERLDPTTLKNYMRSYAFERRCFHEGTEATPAQAQSARFDMYARALSGQAMEAYTHAMDCFESGLNKLLENVRTHQPKSISAQERAHALAQAEQRFCGNIKLAADTGEMDRIFAIPDREPSAATHSDRSLQGKLITTQRSHP